MTRAIADPPIVGLFVGGAGRRMGGTAKGLLLVDGEPIVARTLRLVRELELEPVFVGDASAYSSIAPELVRVEDDPVGIGPLGGLCALLAFARDRPAIALACDMPRVARDDLARLAGQPSSVDVLAARRTEDAPWEPLFARWSPRVLPVARAAIADGVRSFQKLLARLSVERFDASPASLEDWDEPSDVR